MMFPQLMVKVMKVTSSRALLLARFNDDAHDGFNSVFINGITYVAEFAIPTIDIDSTSTGVLSNGTDISIVFSESLADLDSANSTVANQFGVYINGSGSPVTPSSVSLSSSTLTLSLDSSNKIESTDVVSLSYTQDNSNSNAYAIKADSDASLVSSFTNIALNNNSSQDLTKPLPHLAIALLRFRLPATMCPLNSTRIFLPLLIMTQTLSINLLSPLTGLLPL